LVGLHRFGADAELPALEPGQLEGDLLDLGVAPSDVAVLALQESPGLVQLAVAINKGQLTQGELLLDGLPTGDPGRCFGR